ncbi:hypothetical protein EMCG_04185 [[Emmonsia] crescens]|uniref:Uncharacterized protein n=1 Tax=[Emmonsia] crescens TaxID=73230 RepID=A0A0G2HTX7_9EURO|nr:hypothetical protein EMCG_04185 [Emmonsia crescens UAMH 3008]
MYRADKKAGEFNLAALASEMITVADNNNNKIEQVNESSSECSHAVEKKMTMSHSMSHLRHLHRDNTSNLQFDNEDNVMKAFISMRQKHEIEGLSDVISIIKHIAESFKKMSFVNHEFFILSSQKAMKTLRKLLQEQKLC